MREEVVGKAAASRQAVRALRFDRHRDKPGGRIRRATIGTIALDALLRTAKRDTCPQAGGAPAAHGQPIGEIGRRLAVAYQADQARAGREKRQQYLERGRMKAAADDILQPPSEARRG